MSSSQVKRMSTTTQLTDWPAIEKCAHGATRVTARPVRLTLISYFVEGVESNVSITITGEKKQLKQSEVCDVSVLETAKKIHFH